MTIPTTLPKELYSSFVLGYYEGKGSCYTSSAMTRGRSYNRITFSLFGNKEFLNELRHVIKEETGVELREGVLRQKKKEEIHIIRTSSKDKANKIADWMYSGNTIYSEHRDIREILKNV